MFFFVEGCRHTNFGLDTWRCHAVVNAQSRDLPDQLWRYKVGVAWLFFVSKFIDLFDTVFFVLRKNFRQVSG